MDLSGMSRIRSFEEAELHYRQTRDSVANRKDWYSNWAPLDGVRKPHVRIEKHPGEYQCVLYDTPLVTYLLGGQVRLQAWASRASADFANAVLPPGVRAEMVRGAMWFYAHPGYWFQAQGKNTTFQRSDNEPRIFGARERTIVELKRRLVPRLRRTIEPLVEWRKTAQRLGVEPDPTPPALIPNVLTIEQLQLVETRKLFLPYRPGEIATVAAFATGVVSEVTGPGKYRHPPAPPPRGPYWDLIANATELIFV